MTQITITVTEEQGRKLQETASKLDLTPENLVQQHFDEFIEHLDPELDKTLQYLLKKNAELYRRLA